MRANSIRLLAAAFLAFLFLLAIALQPRFVRASGSWYVATTGDDTNVCILPGTPCATINGALNQATFTPGDTILVATGVYTRTGTEVVTLNISATLSGGWDALFLSQSGMSTIDGERARRGITVGGGTVATIQKFTIQNGSAGTGGGIQNAGALLVTGSTIISNSVNGSLGGGILNTGTLVLVDSSVNANSSNWMGGGIYNSSRMTITNSSISNNTTGDPCCSGGGGGGGIENSNATLLTVNNSSISNNKIVGGFSGAGIDVGGGTGTTTLNNSTVSGNTGGDGVGIYSFVGTIILNSSTIANHSSYGVELLGGALNLQNTIIANNATVSGSDCYNYAVYGGTVTSLGYNLIQTNTNCSLDGTDLTGVNPILSSLQNNGGQTLTHALLPPSLAINGGNPSGCNDNLGNVLSTDQRGFSRVGRCDIGAFEYQGVLLQSFLPFIAKQPTPIPTLTPTPTPVPGGYSTIVGTDFEGSVSPWVTFDNNGGSFGEYYWDKRNCRPYSGSYSGWAVGGGANGSGLGCGSNYPDNADSWMVYGPFSLSGATAADLKFKLWLNTESNYDGVCRTASVNGTNFYGTCTSGNVGSWFDRILDLTSVPTLGSVTGQPNVWIALIFTSDADTNFAEGAYVDEVVLRKCATGCTGLRPAPLPSNAKISDTPTKKIRLRR